MPQVLTPAIDVASLEPGTQLVVWQAGSQYRVNVPGLIDFAQLGLGTPGQTLRMNAAGTAIEWFSTWELIETTSLSAVASWARTGLSAYRKLRIGGYFLPATDSVSLFLQTDANGGASYDVGAADYTYQTMRASGASTLTGLSANNIGIMLSPGVVIGNAAAEGIWFFVDIEEFNQARQMAANYRSGWCDAAGAMVSASASGQRNAATARDAFRLIFSSGNIATGFVTLEGIRG